MILNPRRCSICRTRWQVVLAQGNLWPTRFLGFSETPCDWCREAILAYAG